MAMISPTRWKQLFPIVMLYIGISDLPSKPLLTNCIIFIQSPEIQNKSWEDCIAYNKLSILYCNLNCIVINWEGPRVLSYAPWQTYVKDCLNK